MARGILAVLSIALTVFALSDCVQTEDKKVRGVPKWAWIVLIVLLPWVGPITWLFAGKERAFGTGTGTPSPRRGPVAPDEDPDFLRQLDEDIRRERREQKHREPGDPSGKGPDGGTGPDSGGGEPSTGGPDDHGA